MSEKVKLTDGTLNALGVDIKISDIIGEKIVNQWMAQISEDDMQLIFDTIEKEVFQHDYHDKKYFVTKVHTKDHWGSTIEQDTSLWSYVKRLYQEKFNEKIKSKVDEIISSESFEKRADDIAKDIVEYATEGYKIDMQNRIKERLVSNAVDSTVYYNGIDLRTIIHQELNKIIH